MRATPQLACLFTTALALACVLSIPAASQQREPAPAERPAQRIEAVAEEVLLDIVARDKKGRPVLDLRPAEIRIFEEGIEQRVRGFRLVERSLPAPAGRKPGETPVNADRQLNLVTLVFERLSTEGRHLARQGALDFLKNELRENVLIGVFALDQQLYVLQHFTNDRKLLREAIDRATLGGYSQFARQSQAIQEMLLSLKSAKLSAEQAVTAPGIAQDGRQLGGVGAAFSQVTLIDITLRIMEYSSLMEDEQQGRSSIYALLGLVKEQALMRGRKTIVYFSEGLVVPPGLVEALRATIAAANRANVSFYSVDARGLFSERQNEAGTRAILEAVNTTREQLYGAAPVSVTREQVMTGEKAEASLRMNVQGTLADLAESTGGLLIANTNDLRTGMRRVAEDIGSYYELTYRPASAVYDGRFRRIRIEVSRPEVTVQARSGYFAVPPSGDVLFPYEAPLLAALSSSPLPHDFDLHAQALHFAPGEAVEHSIAVEAPLSSFSFLTDEKHKTYRTRFSLMAVVKDAAGQVVRKLSENYPLEGPMERVAALRNGQVLFARTLRLAPGRYTLEAAAYDPESRKASATRSLLMVPPGPPGILSLSSLTLVKRVEALPAAVENPDDPFVFGNTRIVPVLDEQLPGAGRQGVSIYFVVYPIAGAADPPRLEIECLRDGQVVAAAPIELPAPDERGRIPYVASIPFENLPPARYELRAIVRQGASFAQEHVFFHKP